MAPNRASKRGNVVLVTLATNLAPLAVCAYFLGAAVAARHVVWQAHSTDSSAAAGYICTLPA